MEWNPILLRETRSRFRHQAPFWLLLSYAALLALAMGLSYYWALDQFGIAKSPVYRLPAVGHNLFATFCYMQALAWAVITPGITAPAIAREREDGLLEGLLLSPLSPWRIVSGKLLSASSFLTLLIMVSLPVEAICFFTGGVSPGEFWAALFLHACTAFFGISLGLLCSAWCSRANIAMRSAYILMVGWLIGSAICFNSLEYQPIGWTNPIIAATSITDINMAASAAGYNELFANHPWLISAIFQLALGAILLAASCMALKRPLEARDEANLNRLQRTPGTAGQVNSDGTLSGAPRSPVRPAKDWIEVPLFAHLRFTNPVLQREARGKFRLRMPPWWLLFFEILLAIPVAYGYFATLFEMLFRGRERDSTWWVISFIGLIVISMAAAIMGAGAISRERESSTWNALRLSLVTPQEIVRAKLGAILLAFFVYSMPFWPLLAPCVLLDAQMTSKGYGTVSIVQALSTVIILAVTAICYALWGMWWSWRSKRTSVAVGWTLGTLFLILIFGPSFLGVFIIFTRMDQIWLMAFHPLVALIMVVSEPTSPMGLICMGCLGAVSVGLWYSLIAAMKQEKEF